MAVQYLYKPYAGKVLVQSWECSLLQFRSVLECNTKVSKIDFEWYLKMADFMPFKLLSFKLVHFFKGIVRAQQLGDNNSRGLTIFIVLVADISLRTRVRILCVNCCQNFVHTFQL
eukprot:TRINITY_DN14035_c0_g1_i4.p3 TRINITY_DN14035_c0_g1~~TRINITY_DN14035_c0_g1_i4.p3  ORF type:complete len:135 (+),score=0.16 TRINITY_DN14035_c0_g1_i4:61-405(+)